jgi:hypothetical protein
MTTQALVIAHACCGHNSFFKGNHLFRQWTDAEAILDYLVFARRYVMECEERHGAAAVEEVLDACHALRQNGVDRYRRPAAPTFKAETARLAAECDQLAGQNDRLRHLIRQLQRLRFGRRSEKLDPDQLTLGLEDVEQAIAETEAEQEKADPAFKRARAETRRAGRGSLPEHLPRVEIVIEPENTACRCCGSAMQVIGEDRSSRLDVIPARGPQKSNRGNGPSRPCRCARSAGGWV